MIVVERAPALLTIQDRGWRSTRALGLPVSGAMDTWALRLGNAIVGNEDGAAALEWALGAGVLTFECATAIALTGATLAASIGGAPLSPYERVAVPRGASLRVEGVIEGRFAYLAVAGGIATPPLLGSRSTYLPTALGGLDGRPLRTGDRLPVGVHPSLSSGSRAFTLPGALRPDYDATHVRLVPWVQYDSDESAFAESLFSVADESDRMGYRLVVDGGTPARRPQLLPSEGACAGVVQLPESGDPIVLMADGPTVGGYGKLGVVASADLPIVAQRAPRTQLRFTAVRVERAQQLLRRREVDIHTARTLSRETRSGGP